MPRSWLQLNWSEPCCKRWIKLRDVEFMAHSRPYYTKFDRASASGSQRPLAFFRKNVKSLKAGAGARLLLVRQALFRHLAGLVGSITIAIIRAQLCGFLGRRYMSNSAPHPPADQLRAYSLGRLS